MSVFLQSMGNYFAVPVDARVRYTPISVSNAEALATPRRTALS